MESAISAQNGASMVRKLSTKDPRCGNHHVSPGQEQFEVVSTCATSVGLSNQGISGEPECAGNWPVTSGKGCREAEAPDRAFNIGRPTLGGAFEFAAARSNAWPDASTE